jgi:hypothetical protein
MACPDNVGDEVEVRKSLADRQKAREEQEERIRRAAAMREESERKAREAQKKK